MEPQTQNVFFLESQERRNVLQEENKHKLTLKWGFYNWFL